MNDIKGKVTACAEIAQKITGVEWGRGPMQPLACTKGAGAGRRTGALLCSPSFYKLRWLFFHIPPYKKMTGSQRPASKSVERLLMTCLDYRAFFARMASI